MFVFVWRDLKVRYRQTVFGALWAVMQPVLLMVVFTISVGWWLSGRSEPSRTPNPSRS